MERRDGPGLERAYAHCERITRAHYENFPVASRFMPRSRRHHLWAVYAFARTADDFADEPEHEGHRLERLREWGERLDRCVGPEVDVDDRIFLALGDTIRRCELSTEPFHRLLEAFRLDVERSRHEDWDALLYYCARSADPVGRIVLGVFGYHDPELLALSDAICSGLQLANFWQDVAIDLQKDRIYLPAEARRRHGVEEEALREGTADPAFRALMAEMIDRTRLLFQRGRPLPSSVGRDLSFHLKLVWLGGSAILDRIEATGYDVFRQRPKLRRRDWLMLGARALSPLSWRKTTAAAMSELS